MTDKIYYRLASQKPDNLTAVSIDGHYVTRKELVQKIQESGAFGVFKYAAKKKDLFELKNTETKKGVGVIVLHVFFLNSRL
jgi:hypothetical protein